MANENRISASALDEEAQHQPSPVQFDSDKPESPSQPQDHHHHHASSLPNNAIDDSALPPPPDGGLHAWTQVAMGWIAIFTTWGYINSFGSFQTYYTATLPVSPSAISWIGSLQTWLTYFIGAFSGRMLDAGFFLPTFVVGAVLQLLGIFLMSISRSYWHLMLTQGLLTGIGGGIFFTPCLALVATYFDKRRGLAIGLATTGNSAGGIVYPLVVRQLLPHVGFAWTARTLGFINLAGLTLVSLLMRPRLPPRRSGPVIDWAAFKEPVYIFFVGGVFFFMWCAFYTMYYIGSFGTETLNLDYSHATLLVTLINGAGFPVRILIPIFADRLGALNFITLSSIAVLIVSFSWLAVHSVPGLWIFTVFYGIANGSYQSLLSTAVASITTQLDKVGTRIGMCFSISSFAGLTGPPIGGQIQLASGGSSTWAIVWAALSSLISCLLTLSSRWFRAGAKLDARV